MNFVSVSPMTIGGGLRDPGLPPLSLNPLAVAAIVPNGPDPGLGCTVITTNNLVMSFSQTVDEMTRILQGVTH